MTIQFVDVRCQYCQFKRRSVGLSGDKFTDNKGYQVTQHLIKHPDHVIRIVSKTGYNDYKLENGNLKEVS
jgi:hypothetical protein